MQPQENTPDFVTSMALIGLDDEILREEAAERLASMGFLCHSGGSQADLLGALRMQLYQVVLIPEAYAHSSLGDNEVLQAISELPLDTRREMFCVLVSPRFATADDFKAFILSVDMTVHVSDVARLDEVLQMGLSRRREKYAMFHEVQFSVEIE